jgi:voltage-gated potassium channel
MENFSFRRFAWAVAAFALVLVVGTVGFRLMLDEGWMSSLYRSVVTVSLSGLDTKPEGTAAEIFTIVLLIAGVAIFLYVAGVIVEVIAGGVLTGAWAERRRRLAIERLRDHYVICGYGRVGRRVGSELRTAGREYVVVDFNQEVLAEARARDDHVVEGNGTRDEDLIAAGIERAAGLVASSDSDVDNLYITITARALKPSLLIVARASDEHAAEKLRRAGADRVVQPYSTAGKELANLVLKPQVAMFLDLVSTGAGPDFRFEEILVAERSAGCGKAIGDLSLPEGGAMIVAIRRHDGIFDATPGPAAVVETGDILIGVGTPDELAVLERLFAPDEAVARR